MVKNYYDKNISEYIDKRFESLEFIPEYKYLFKEIFLRRKYQFNLSEKESKEEIESFCQNVSKIEIKKLPDNHVVGKFIGSKKKIIINKNDTLENKFMIKFKAIIDILKDFRVKEKGKLISRIVKGSYEKIYAKNFFLDLSHEVHHAINYGKNEKNELIEDKTFGEIKFGLALLEIFSEEASNRIYINKSRIKSKRLYFLSNGYEDLTQYFYLISSAFGIEENELLSAYVKGKKEFFKVLKTNIEDYEEPDFAEVSVPIELIYKTIYLQGTEINKEASIKNIIDNNKYLYYAAEKIINRRIKNLNLDNLEETKKEFEKIKLDQLNVRELMRETYIRQLGKRLNGPIMSKFTDKEIDEIKKDILGKLQTNDRNYTILKLLCIDKILNSKLEDKEKVKLVNLLKEVEDSKTMTKIADEIDVSYVEITEMSFEITEEDSEEDIWENEALIDYILKNRTKLKGNISFINRIKEKLKNFNKKRLEAGSQGKKEVIPDRATAKAGKTKWKVNKSDLPPIVNIPIKSKRNNNRGEK